MNNTFDWNRFCKVINKDFRNLWPMFGTTAIVLATLPFAIWLLALVCNRNFVIDPNYRVVMLMGFSSLAALMLPSRLYRTMNLRNEGIYYAMLPASKLEKFLSMLLFTFIVAPLVVYLGSLVLDIILRLMPAGAYREWIWQGDGGFPLFTRIPMDDDTIPGFHSWLLTAATYSSCLASPAIFLYAATLFKKHKVLYTLEARLRRVGLRFLQPLHPRAHLQPDIRHHRHRQHPHLPPLHLDGLAPPQKDALLI